MPRLPLNVKILIGEISFLAIAAAILSAFHFPKLLPMNIYLFLHLLGAVMFVGNIVVTALWMFFAERTKNTDVITFATRMVTWADVFFTGPGVILLLLDGLLMAPYCAECTQGLLTHWVLLGFGLFGVSGALWIVLLTYQNKLLRGLQENPKQFYRILHRWYAVGAINTVIPLLILGIMVVKPTL